MTKESRKEPQSSPPDPPQTEQTLQASPRAGLLPFEQHAAGLPVWEQAALRASAGWLPGQELTAEQFGAAYKAMHEEVIL